MERPRLHKLSHTYAECCLPEQTNWILFIPRQAKCEFFHFVRSFHTRFFCVTLSSKKPARTLKMLRITGSAKEHRWSTKINFHLREMCGRHRVFRCKPDEDEDKAKILIRSESWAANGEREKNEWAENNNNNHFMATTALRDPNSSGTNIGCKKEQNEMLLLNRMRTGEKSFNLFSYCSLQISMDGTQARERKHLWNFHYNFLRRIGLCAKTSWRGPCASVCSSRRLDRFFFSVFSATLGTFICRTVGEHKRTQISAARIFP